MKKVMVFLLAMVLCLTVVGPSVYGLAADEPTQGYKIVITDNGNEVYSIIKGKTYTVEIFYPAKDQTNTGLYVYRDGVALQGEQEANSYMTFVSFNEYETYQQTIQKLHVPQDADIAELELRLCQMEPVSGGNYIPKSTLASVTYSVKDPLKVTGLKAEPAGKNKVKLTWNAVEGADGYLIYGQKSGKYGYVGMTTKGTSFIDAKALSEDYNFYWVFPYTEDSSGKKHAGGCEKYVFAKGVCAAVTNLKASSVKGGVRLNWTASPGAEGYLVYGIVDGKPYGYVGMASGTSYIDKKASSTAYNYYWIFPYFKNESGKMIVGLTGKYTYGRALQ